MLKNKCFKGCEPSDRDSEQPGGQVRGLGDLSNLVGGTVSKEASRMGGLERLRMEDEGGWGTRRARLTRVSSHTCHWRIYLYSVTF